MNATDLMLGDWVYNSSKEKCKVHAISNIFDSNIHLDNYDKPNDGCFELAFEVEPIPLTPEILEKNGFTKDSDDDESHYWFTLIDSHTKFSLLYARSVFQWINPLDFKYVHELQHALKLCGINKKVLI